MFCNCIPSFHKTIIDGLSRPQGLCMRFVLEWTRGLHLRSTDTDDSPQATEPPKAIATLTEGI